jgi:hypothetical protein
MRDTKIMYHSIKCFIVEAQHYIKILIKKILGGFKNGSI